MNQTKRFFGFGRLGAFVGWFLFISLFFACNNDSDTTIAEVGDYTVSKSDLMKRMNAFQARVGDGIPDTGQFRTSILNQLVDEKLMLTYAHERKFDQDQLAEQEKERVEIQGLLNTYLEKYVTSSVKASDTELIEYFARFNTKLKARHLFAISEETADSLYQLLESGADFSALARSTFKSKELRESGGSIGYFTVDDMDPFFEEAAYALEVGGISKPVKTAYGYSIIQLEERVANPLMTENQFASKKAQLTTFVTKRKQDMRARDYVDSLANSYHIKFNEPVLEKLFTEIKLITSSDQAEVGTAALRDLADQELISFDGGSWTVREFQNRARFTSREQQAWVRNEHTLREFVRGLLARSRMLEIARAEKLDKSDSFREDVNYQFDSFLISRVENELERRVHIPVDSARAYFDVDPNRYALPPQIAVRTIGLNNIDMANEVKIKLEAGASFKKLQNTYNDQPKDLPMVYYSPQQFGGLAPTIFELKPGEWTGPHNVDELMMFFQCVDIKPARKRSFEEAKVDVETTLQMMFHDKLRKAFLTELRTKTPNQIYPERIRSLN